MGRKRDRQPKTKICFHCQQPTMVAYRVRYDANKIWDFVCPGCLLPVKTNNPNYVYGGTWKSERH